MNLNHILGIFLRRIIQKSNKKQSSFQTDIF